MRGIRNSTLEFEFLTRLPGFTLDFTERRGLCKKGVDLAGEFLVVDVARLERSTDASGGGDDGDDDDDGAAATAPEARLRRDADGALDRAAAHGARTQRSGARSAPPTATATAAAARRSSKTAG